VLTFFFFAALCLLHVKNYYYTAGGLDGSLEEFLIREQGTDPKRPMILVGGSSRNGMAIHIEELERRTGVACSKVSCSAGHLSETFGLIKRFQRECDNVKIVIADVNTANFRVADFNNFREVHLRRKLLFEQPTDFLMFLQTLQSGNLAECFPRISLATMWNFYCKIKWLAEERELPYFESRWFSEKFKKGTEVDRITLKQESELALQKNPNLDPQPFLRDYRVDEGDIQFVHEFVMYCREHGIFVVLNISPEWYGRLTITQNDLGRFPENEYLSLLAKLDQMSNCKVIVCRNFQEITSDGTDEDYLFDKWHMTEPGANLYTNWLADQMLKSPKIISVLNLEAVPK